MDENAVAKATFHQLHGIDEALTAFVSRNQVLELPQKVFKLFRQLILVVAAPLVPEAEMSENALEGLLHLIACVWRIIAHFAPGGQGLADVASVVAPGGLELK